MPSSTVGSFLFQYLYDQGIHHAFGIPGDFALPTFRWLAKSPIELITMVHEPGVGFAADAYSRAHGGLGLAVVTYCVAGTIRWCITRSARSTRSGGFMTK
jgi:thiamine pyrophosphate-dependent acetolactate synthase large subunit-like protein